MPWGTVRVEGPAGDEIFINGNYEQAAGRTGDTFIVEYGLNTFETLDGIGAVVLRANAVVDPVHPHREVPLEPVVVAQPGDGR